MRIAIIGGTGRLGRPLAARLIVAGYKVAIGSRSKEKAKRAAGLVEKLLASYGLSGRPFHGLNREVAEWADTVIVAVPLEGIGVLGSLKDVVRGKVVISAVGSVRREGNRLIPVLGGSVASRIAAELEEAEVAATFHTVSHVRLAKLTERLRGDVPVFGGGRAVDVAAELVETVPELRPVYAGPLELSITAEILPALLVAVSKSLGLNGASIKFV